jgi:hypothetical protein
MTHLSVYTPTPLHSARYAYQLCNDLVEYIGKVLSETDHVGLSGYRQPHCGSHAQNLSQLDGPERDAVWGHV